MGFFDKLKKITTNLFSGFTEADEAFFEELEEKETNFEYLKDYLGKSEVEGIVEYARSKEQADREKERYYGRGR